MCINGNKSRCELGKKHVGDGWGTRTPKERLPRLGVGGVLSPGWSRPLLPGTLHLYHLYISGKKYLQMGVTVVDMIRSSVSKSQT